MRVPHTILIDSALNLLGNLLFDSAAPYFASFA